MRILSLQLENIKSYVHAEIHFAEGLNAISGQNGAGKTTILEAIGFALFNSLPYRHPVFVREGEKSGTVRVRIETRDGRQYEVVRRIGAGNPYYVHDLEFGTRLAERLEPVQDWIRTHALGIEGRVDLAALFKNAVGVPQGLMTGDFLQNAGPRKGIFDPLLRVDEYNDAFVTLLETVRYLKDLRANLSEEIGRLSADAERVPEAEAEVDRLGNVVRESAARLAQVQEELQVAAARRALFEERAAALQAADRDVQDRAAEVRAAENDLTYRQTALDTAQHAHAVVTAAAAAYHAYREARSALDALEPKRVERDRVRADLAVAAGKRDGIFSTVQGLDRRLQETERAQRDADALADDVVRQEGLEATRLELEKRLAAIPTLEAAITSTAASIATLDAVLRTLEDQVSAARAASQETGALPELEERAARLSAAQAGLIPVAERRTAVADLGKRLRTDRDEIVRKKGERDASLASLREILPLAEQYEGLLDQRQTLVARRAGVEATLAYREVAEAALRQRHCPLLDVQCPVVTADGTIITRFTEQVDTFRADLTAVSGELQALDAALGPARRAWERAQTLRVEAARLDMVDAQLSDIEEKLRDALAEYRALDAQLEGAAALRQELAAVEARLTRVRQNAALAATLEVHLARQEAETAARSGAAETLARLQAERAELKDLEVDRRAVDRDLALLDDPRGRRRDALARAGERSVLERELAEQHVTLKAAADQVKALAAALEQFAGLDGETQSYRDAIRTQEQSHNDYLQHLTEAGTVSERQAAVDDTQGRLALARKALTHAQSRSSILRADYDAAAHAAADASWKTLVGDARSAETELQHRGDELQRAERMLADYRRQAEKLRAREQERAETERVAAAAEFIRSTIKAAGPIVTETLLHGISAVANDIYAEIMDDHAAELRWEGDYEVVVQRGPEVRSFAQLSGGEQMSAALSVRLALLKEMSDVDFAFFDEPTQNMDLERRSNLASQIQQVRGFEQIMVISHDDTFEHHTDNLIRLRKEHDVTVVESS